jgi:hypothetical protein
MSRPRILTPRLRQLALVLAVVTGWAAAPAPARGQANIAVLWDFNGSTTNPSINNATGTAAAALLGGATATFDVGDGSTDPAAAGSNFAWNTTDYPAEGTGSGTAGVRFNTPTTSASGGFDNVVIRFDQRNSATAARHFLLEYTLNGTDWLPAGPNNGVYETTLNDVFFTRTLDLSGVAAAANNANLAFRTRAVFDPATGTGYAPTTGTSAYATTGTARFDMVTVTRGVRWVGGSGTGAEVPANWQGGAPPGAADTVLLGASANTAITVPAAPVTVGQLVFRADAPSYTISGTGPLMLAAGIANDSPNRQTVAVPVTFTGTQTVRNNGTLVFNGAVTVANNGNLNLAGTGLTAINGTYTGNDVNVTAGHTLAGIGTITNEVQIYTGKIRGGVTDGTNNFGTLTVNVAADLELYAAPGNRAPAFVIEATRTGPGTVNNSRIALVGGTGTDLELNDAGVGTNRLRFEVVATNLVVGETYTMTILTTDSIGSIEFNNAASPDGFVFPAGSYDLVASNYAVQNPEVRVVDVAGASTLVVTFTPVPEPATVLAVAAAGLAAAGLTRRRK